MQADRFRRRLAAAEVLFRAGDAGQEAYVIESGAIEIYSDSSGEHRVLAQLGADDIFGEMALAGDQTRTASARATVATVLRVITHEYLSERLNQADPLLRHLLRVTMARSRQSLQRALGTLPTSEQPGVGSNDRELALKRLRMEQDLQRGLSAGEFLLHFQPILRLSDESVAGFEALIRWNRGGQGLVPPIEFIGVAEDSGFIVPLGHWIIESACAGLVSLQAASPAAAPLFMSINLSIRQFSDPELFPTLQRALARHGLDPGRIKLEVTESLVMNNLEAAQSLLQACKALGAQLAVDDFGTGYSSLSYLHKLPMDTLKLDRSFLRDISGNAASAKIVRAIGSLAADLGMDTVAEGVETAEHGRLLRDIGITYVQGFHYSRPLALEPALAYLRGRPGA